MCDSPNSVIYVNPSFDPNELNLDMDSSSANFAEIDLLVTDSTLNSGHVSLKKSGPKTSSPRKQNLCTRKVMLIAGTVLMCALLSGVVFTFAFKIYS